MMVSYVTVHFPGLSRGIPDGHWDGVKLHAARRARRDCDFVVAVARNTRYLKSTVDAGNLNFQILKCREQ